MSHIHSPLTLVKLDPTPINSPSLIFAILSLPFIALSLSPHHFLPSHTFSLPSLFPLKRLSLPFPLPHACFPLSLTQSLTSLSHSHTLLFLFPSYDPISLFSLSFSHSHTSLSLSFFSTFHFSFSHTQPPSFLSSLTQPSLIITHTTHFSSPLSHKQHSTFLSSPPTTPTPSSFPLLITLSPTDFPPFLSQKSSFFFSPTPYLQPS